MTGCIMSRKTGQKKIVETSQGSAKGAVDDVSDDREERDGGESDGKKAATTSIRLHKSIVDKVAIITQRRGISAADYFAAPLFVDRINADYYAELRKMVKELDAME